MKNVIVRSISGIVYIAIFVSFILLGVNYFSLLTLILTILGVWEFLKLEQKRYGERIPVTVYVIVFAASIMFSICCWSTNHYCFGNFLTGCLLLLPCWLALLIHSVLSKSQNSFSITSVGLTAFLYIALPLSLLDLVYLLPEHASKSLLLSSLICIWINDTGAYCVGCTIGKHRLCERLSPKKSWEGFWGGMFFAILAMAIYAYCEDYNVIIYAVYGAVISVLATLGDLFESMIKRSAGVKDSGRIIPGHGGILDRIDSLLFVAYAILFMFGFEIIEKISVL